MTRSALSRDERLRWLIAIAWSALIFVTVPLTESIQELVTRTIGRDAFLNVVLVVTALATIGVLARARVSTGLSIARGFVLLGFALVFVSATVRLSSVPEEAVHFVEYGILAALAHRALAPRMRNGLIYPAAFMFAAAIALIDEGLQWATPGRYWELRDVGLNLTAASLVELAIALGLAPRYARGRIDARSGRRLLRMTCVVVLLLAASMFNTPERIAWYTSKVPTLAFLAHADSAMFEYGYYYDDADTGSFKSRLPPEKLAASDLHRGAEVGAILDRYAQPREYADVLRMYSPVTDPFVHEVRVHLFRRDRYLERASEYPKGSPDHRRCMTVAYSEHKILEKYFGNTVAHSTFVMSPDRLQAMTAQLLPAAEQARAIARSESAVSRNLVTAITQRTLASLFVVLVLALLVSDRRLTAIIAEGGKMKS